MPHIIIDGNSYEVKPNMTIIEAAQFHGLHIPHFCWHPELSVSGNCRMCLVEVGMPKRLPDGSFEKDENGKNIVTFFPKLQIACATQVTDGMNVRTNSKAAVNAQEAVMEFLLINHPLDCPICDEAGQCKLQEYAFNHSNGESRFDEQKNPKPKRVSWGPNVLYDAERCISCSRCIRFANEVAGQEVLTFVNRGDHVTIELFENTELDSPYSMNVIDICPVGALTSKDFRFKSRVWDMSFNDSICNGCSRGCNIKLGVRRNEILRVEPGSNPYVNKTWMCDYGRFAPMNTANDDRIDLPLIKISGNQTETNWETAVVKAAELMKKFKPGEIMFVGSPMMSNEDNYLFAKFAKKIIKSQNLDFVKYQDEKFKDNFLKTSDKSPNSAGCTVFGFVPSVHSVGIANLADSIGHGQIRAVYSLDGDFNGNQEIIKALENLDVLILHQSNKNNLTSIADVVFPASVFAESEGTFINSENRVQHFSPALVTGENMRTMGMKLSRIDKFGASNDRWSKSTTRNCYQSWRIIQLVANAMGASWNYRKSVDIFKEITQESEGFRDMSYELLDDHQGVKLGSAKHPDPKIRNYVSNFMKPN